MKQEVNVAVVGGSVAGASAALTLAKSGLTVALFEKRSADSRKPCGEGLSRRGAVVLDELSIDTSAIGRKLCGYRIGTFDSSDTSVVPGDVLGIDRVLLDCSLRSAIAGCPRISFENCRVNQIRSLDRSFEICSDTETIRCRYLILACSGSSPLMGALAVVERPRRQLRYGLSTVGNGAISVIEDRVNVLVGPDCTVFVTPTSSSTLNISILANREQMGGVTQRKQEILDAVRERYALCNLKFEMFRAAGPISSSARSLDLPRAYLVGDAHEIFDPVGGMGMTHAALTGREAALAIVATERGTADEVMRNRYRCFQARLGCELRGFTTLTMLATHKSTLRRIAGTAVGSRIAAKVVADVHTAPKGFSFGRVASEIAGIW